MSGQTIHDGGVKVISDFKVRKEMFEDTQHETLHFELMLDGKEYQGHYKNDEVNWFQMQPSQEDHEISIDELEDEVRNRLRDWKEIES
ncbi:hypothetical protein MHZ95_05880 [Sporosarcina sp. ACRSM]|uniref:hypothetical protein n=1 Tax=Sporosarcina sp. ACRSM TaxID=2918216 RepID=UPI001EF55C4B|nr:hypothetical protein [Sporosarcina sp. ACRSM]MCG7334798.1 hypothetical protein [Sporosarcina sp. ACRSM]